MSNTSSPFAPKTSATNNRNGNQQKAEAFGNCSFEVDGNEYKIPKGIPMDSNNRVTRSMINAAKAAAEKGDEFTVTLTCTVKLVVDDSGLEDIKFG